MQEALKSTSVEIRDLRVCYKEQKRVLDNVSLTLPSKKIIGVIGPNGAGKSTLLKAAMGLIPYQAGTIELLGKPVDAVRRWVSFVPQKETVDWDFPASVFDIALLGCYNRLGFFERPTKRDRERAMQCLEEVGMADLANRQIGELSGGQQQRVFLARALAQDAHLYFMDEPFAAVDITTEKAIVSLLKKMVAAGKTVVVVHHDLCSVYEYFDWMVLLNRTVVATGETKTVFTAAALEQTYGSKFPFMRSFSPTD